MPRPRRILAFCGFVFPAICFAAESTNDPRDRRPPNILFLAVDDLRCELGCYGVDAIISPNIDRLAASAVKFTRAYCQLAVCNPSRVSVMTGMRPDTTMVWDLRSKFRETIPDAITMPQHFRQHGYHAVSFGKIFHNPWPDQVSWDEPHRWPQDAKLWSKESQQRLAEYRQQMRKEGKNHAQIQRMRAPAIEVSSLSDSEHRDGAIADQAISALDRLAKLEQPFFLATGFVRPHLPFVVPKKYWDLYRREDIRLATNGYLPKNMPELAFGSSPQGGFYELRDYMDFADAVWPLDGSLTPAQQRELKHGYYAAVSFIDAQIGRLLDKLDALHLTDDTIVVLWSDHGWKLGEHNGWCKQTNFEIDTRVPLLIRDPRIKSGGAVSNSLVELVDLYPTLCELSGIPSPDFLEGASLAPILAEPDQTVKTAAISQFPHRRGRETFMGYSLRTDEFRYTVWISSTSGAVAARELYDHRVDTQENENVADAPQHAERIEQLDSLLWETIPNPMAEFNALLKSAS
tara:strand:- start:151526 stop:153076 length:1551 start_codon:yes stop_codon:yes gene_type:complete